MKKVAFVSLVIKTPKLNLVKSNQLKSNRYCKLITVQIFDKNVNKFVEGNDS